MPLDRFAQANRANWESRVAIHTRSRTYDVAGFAADPGRLSDVVEFDRRRVGDVRGKRLVHLQCHIGTDTLSWARLGADVTGVDFSPSALNAARQLAAETDLRARFVEADVHEAAAVLGERFDIVYTGVGALNWLPSMARWAAVVADLLAPGGMLHLREGHPVLYTLDDERDDDLLVITYPYFEQAEPNRWEDRHTYTDGEEELEHPVNYEWPHGIADVLTALLGAGLTLTSFEEHRFADWKALPQMVEGPGGTWHLPEGGECLPLMYSLSARAPG